MTKPTRPKAGLGLSSALGRDQITTRKSTKAATRKPPRLRSGQALSARTAKPKRTPKGDTNAG